MTRYGWLDTSRRRPVLLEHPHPLDTPGAYRVPARLARLLRARAPRCEWPACGCWAAGCDLDHDRAHPDGATCGCPIGPACRRHHRVKQLLMTKTRSVDGVRWTSPTGRSWLSPSQHQPPQPPIRPRWPCRTCAAPGDPRLDQDGSTDLDWLSGRADVLRTDDPFDRDPEDLEDLFEALAADGWGLALDDPTRWAA